MRKYYTLLVGLLLFANYAHTQVENDDCETAFPIADVTNYCSPTNDDNFSNIGATSSGYDASSCFSNSGNDVWFSFIAFATDINIIIRGSTRTAPGGTLSRPEATLYEGTCGGVLQELECQTDNEGNDIIELYKGGLLLGQTYLIRVQGRGGREGTFQLCTKNFNPPTDPSSDCPEASILCDKSGFSVQKVTGAGFDRTELDDANCFSNGTTTNNETNSTWYTWTCDEPGDLTFTLTPSNETDDLDFVLYELPNGIGDCRGKRVLRCMASGDFAYPSRCMGPTGLRAGEDDNSEQAGCGSGRQNNFLSPLNMESGKTYALGINNFTSTDNGFSIEFGGSGTFRGPEANFILDASIAVDEDDQVICLNEDVEFTDASRFDAGRITGWTWTFGVGASTTNQSGEGPHQINYQTAGEKLIALTIETDLGCTVTEVTTINVLEPPTIEFDLSLPDCGGGDNGGITLSGVGGSVPYQFSWIDIDAFTSDNERNNLSEGTYEVVVRDAQNCTSEPFEIFLPEDSIQLNESVLPVVEPSCAGFSDGILTISPIRGSAPYEFNFGSGFTTDNSLSNISAGSYTVSVRDVNGCNSTFAISVDEPDSLMLDLNALDISCKGLTDGTIETIISGGVGGYVFNWNTNATTAALSDLVEGDYSVTVQDANGCEITQTAFINEPEGIDFEIQAILDAICPGEASGSIILNAVGGTPPFEYGIVGGNFQTSPMIDNLFAGDYEVQVRDARGCESEALLGTVEQPDSFFVDAGQDQVIELGFDTDLQAVVLPFNKQVSYQWTTSDSTVVDCVNCTDITVFPFNSTIYNIIVTDEDGCTAMDQVLIRVEKNYPVFAPNIFSPNSGDTSNSRFTVFGGRASLGIKTLRVFSRWGDLIFEMNDVPIGVPEVGWDGTVNGEPVVSGVYAFYAEVEFLDQEVIVVEGDVTLVR